MEGDYVQVNRLTVEHASEHFYSTLKPIDLSNQQCSDSNCHIDMHASTSNNVDYEEEYYMEVDCDNIVQG